MSIDMNNMNSASNGSSRGNWGTTFGFILAATGSAIGLGNIWKFPYITGVYGGGAFVLIYLGCVVIVGLPLMMSELIIGRKTQRNPIGAFNELNKSSVPWQLTGWLGVASGFVILSFYSVIAGWSIAYIFKSIAGFSGSNEMIQGQFGLLAGDPVISTFWHTLFMALTIAIVIGGVQRGIERWSKILMPLLFLILLILMLYGLFYTEGGSRAWAFLFKPNFSELSAEAVLSALGHAFFTLSLGMGAMLTYGSYMRRTESITRDAITISILDTVIALMAGLAIYSLVFSYNMDPAQGPGLIFTTLPVLFADLGQWVSVPFFVLLVFAALTSAISLLEVVVSFFIDEKTWSRKKATLILGTVIYLIGIVCAISSGVFDFFDKASTNYMLPLGGLLTGLFVGWVLPKDLVGKEFGSFGILFSGLRFTLRFITPVAVIIVFLHGLGLV